MRSAACCFVIVLAACGDSGPPHWSQQPLATFEDTHEGTAFTIELPKGMQKSAVRSKYSVEYGYHATVKGEDYLFPPSVSVGKVANKPSLAQAIAIYVQPSSEVLVQEQTAGGWVLAITNTAMKRAEDYLVYGQTVVGDGALTCRARLYPMTKGGTAKRDLPRVVKMCQSLKAK